MCIVSSSRSWVALYQMLRRSVLLSCLAFEQKDSVAPVSAVSVSNLISLSHRHRAWDQEGWLKWRRTRRLCRSPPGIPEKGHLNGAGISPATWLRVSQSAECSQKARRDTEIKSKFQTARQKQANSFTNRNPAAPMCRYVNVKRLESLSQSTAALNSLNRPQLWSGPRTQQ